MNAGILTGETGGTGGDAHEIKSRYQQLLAAVTDYVYTVSVSDGKPTGTFHGPGCEAVTGYTSRDFAADPYLWLRMVYEEDRPLVLERAERILCGEVPPALEHRIVRKDGRIRWIRNTTVPHRDELGRLVMYDGLVADISERKEAELALRESQNRLALVIQGSSDGIWDWNLLTNEVFFSPRWKSMLGYEDHELDNHLSAWVRLLHPEDWETCLDRIDSHLSGETPTYEVEHRLRHKDGSYRWILARGVAHRDAHGRPVRMAGSHVDLTQRKFAEEQLREAYAELQANQSELKRTLEDLKVAHEELQTAQLQLVQTARMEAVAELARGVAHDLRNLLQPIELGVYYLDHSVPKADPNMEVVLAEMRDAARRSEVILNDMLDVSGNQDFQPRDEDLNRVMEDSLRLVHNKLLSSGIVVDSQLAPDLPHVWIDRAKIERVFLNLFFNAIQAMAKGGRLYVVTRADRFNGGINVVDSICPPFEIGEQVVVAEIRDTGTGIPVWALPRIFDACFTTKPRGEGTGLGLSLVKTFMDLHCGAIDVRNAPDCGAIATVILRVERPTKVRVADGQLTTKGRLPEDNEGSQG